MADIPNRTDLEDQFARELAAIVRKHQAEWSTGIAAPQTEQETRRWLLLFLPLLFVAGSRVAASELGIGLDPRGPADTWARNMAPPLSRRIVTRLLERVRLLRMNPPIDQEELNRLLDELAAEERWANLAATEVTRAAVAGGEFSASVHDATMSEPALAFWYVSTKKGVPDDRVCPVCKPFHLTEREVWGHPAAFPLGPPAHSFCRCYVNYQPQ